MKNNILGKIKMSLDNRHKARLSLSHDVSTTASFGDLQPTCCKLVLPNSNGHVSAKTLVRFGTMLAPTFGRIKAKEYHTLVKMSDLFYNFPFLMAQSQRLNANGAVLNVTEVPNLALGLLSRYCLIGAELTVYVHTSTDASNKTVIYVPKDVNNARNNGSNNNNVQTDIGAFFQNRTDTGSFNGYSGFMFDVGAFTQAWGEANSVWTSQAHNFWIPIKNVDFDGVFGIKKESVLDGNGQPLTVETLKQVPLDKSSICITTEINGRTYTFAFRLGSFGKRMRKQIVATGHQINMTSTAPVHLLGLFADWKAYFDLFAVTLYTSFEVSPLYRFLQWIDQNNYTNLAFAFGWPQLTNFIVELGRMWYTDQQDVISAHVTSTAISPSLGLGSDFIDVDGVAHITEVDNQNGTQVNGHAFIDAVEHGQLDAEYLLRCYKWMNQNTVAGRAVEKRLRAQNLGKYVDQMKSNFIGYHEEQMDIFDVVSQSDTYDSATNTGSMLGEYGGRGLKVYKTKDMSWETDEYAFRVSLLTIVPEAGYLQSIDPSCYCIKKTDFMLDMIDGLGMEASRKTLVCGAENWSSQVAYVAAGSMDDTFGLIPRGTHLKLAHNIANGDFTLRDTRDGYLRYTMDRFIDVGERTCKTVLDQNSYKLVEATRELMPSEVAHASPIYRYPCRYPWMGNFARIFAYQGEPRDDDFYLQLASDPESEALKWELLNNEYDNFIVHSMYNEPYFAPCKPIEETFGTIGDDEKPNASMEKA